MPATTPKLLFPYPVGTDRVTDGDNAMQALAEKMDALLGTTRVSVFNKAANSPGFKSTAWYALGQNQAALNMTVAGLVFVKACTDISAMTASGYVMHRIGTDDGTINTFYDPIARAEFVSTALMYLPAGDTLFVPQVSTYQNSAGGITIGNTRWSAHAFGGTPSWH